MMPGWEVARSRVAMEKVGEGGLGEGGEKGHVRQDGEVFTFAERVGGVWRT